MKRSSRWVRLSICLLLLLPASAGADVGGRAEKTYNQLWRKAARFYGAQGQPPPQFQKMPRAGAVGSLNTDRSGAVPVVSARPWILRELAGKYGGKPGYGLAPKAAYRRQAEKSLLHEWAHVFQRPEIFNDVPTAEYDASHFAQHLAKRLIARPGKREKLPLDRSQFWPLQAPSP